jgi:putative transposase
MTGVTLNYYAQANQLKDIRRDCPEIGAVNFSMLQAICRRAQRSYDNFFRRLRDWQDRKAQGLPAGKRPGPPRLKGYLRFNSITFPSYGDGCKLSGQRLRIHGVGTLKVKLHRPVGGPIKTVTLKRVGARWYAVIVCEVAVVPLPATGQSVGIDLGLEAFLMTDTGKPVPNPRPLRTVQLSCGGRNVVWHAKRKGAAGGRGNGGEWPVCTRKSPMCGATSTTRPRMILCRPSM